MGTLFETIAQLFSLDLSNFLHWIFPALTPLVNCFISVGTTTTNAINSGIDWFFG